MATMPTGHVLTFDDRTYFGIDMPVPRENLPLFFKGEGYKIYWCVYTSQGKRIGQGHRKHWQAAKQAIRQCAKRWHQRYKAGKTCDCCDRGGEYNGFGSGPTIFTCPKNCSCHD